MADSLRLALGTLTGVPVRPPTRVDRSVAGTAVLLAPLVGLALGAAAAAVFWAGSRVGLPAPTCAVLAVVTLVLLSRGLHLDGLADTADGLSASPDRDRALAVMRSGDVGPIGVAAVVLVLLVQVSALAAGGPVAVLLAAVVGRAGLALGCLRAVPAARDGGLGAGVAGSVPPAAAALVCALVVAAAGMVWRPWYQGAAAAVLGLAVVAVVVRHAVRRLGGVTGDVLGACVEVATAATLVALAVQV